MSCYYTMDWLEIPATLAPGIEALIKQHELEGAVAVAHDPVPAGEKGETREYWYIHSPEGSMGYSTVSDIAEKLFPEVARLLKDTELDGQVIITECDDEPATTVFLGGECKEHNGRLQVADCDQVAKGQEADVQLPHHVLGLGNGKVLILK